MIGGAAARGNSRGRAHVAIACGDIQREEISVGNSSTHGIRKGWGSVPDLVNDFGTLTEINKEIWNRYNAFCNQNKS